MYVQAVDLGCHMREGRKDGGAGGGGGRVGNTGPFFLRLTS